MDSRVGAESTKRTYNFVKSSVGLESNAVGTTTQHYGVKEIVRHKFGKSGKLMSSFGCHPDFDEMDEGELRNGYSVTLFMDIIGSTKLGVVFPPETVFKIKNDIIRCAIETVNSFDGHVHRIMGDAVMAFFRMETYKQQGRIADSAIDAINCATFLIEMFKGVVIPKLNDLGIDENLGIRIGIDYGADDQVIWGKYGYMESQEVTATSFFVDVAAKLQQKAPKNSIMIGDSLAKLIGFDENQLSIKTKIKDGVATPVKYLTPNYKDANGELVNYKQYVLKNEHYCSLLPTSDENSELIVKATLKMDKNASSDDEYYPCSRVIKKGMGISFKGILILTIITRTLSSDSELLIPERKPRKQRVTVIMKNMKLRSILMAGISRGTGRILPIKAFITCMCLFGMGIDSLRMKSVSQFLLVTKLGYVPHSAN